MFVINSIVAPKVQAKPYIINQHYDEQGQCITDKKPNPNYPGEQEMKINQIIYFLIPTGQADAIHTTCTEMIEFDEEEVHRRRKVLNEMPIYALGVIGLANIGGIYILKRQEIN